MRFFPKEICQKLVELGCVSSSNFIWKQMNLDKNGYFTTYGFKSDLTDTEAFTLLDFIDTTEQAKENMEKVFRGHSVYRHLHAIIDSPDGIEYITNVVSEK